ncbi:epithelial-stromal interaction protein 1 [Eucyclogobius newberryi]|uniref:epithelial-stromal interaction protein 1 n=1 Tax=Eucyclogobius newberryi TaxID=166745 RepID=UPI003B599E41
MNPRQNQRDQMNNTDPNHLRNDSSSENTARNSAAEQGPQYGNGFTMFPPNETRRNNWRESAQREVESLETLREAQRSAPVHMDPARLGGNRTMAEVREQQNRDQRNIKLQKQMKQGDEKRRKKEEEERQLQEIKDIHRKKVKETIQNKID